MNHHARPNYGDAAMISRVQAETANRVADGAIAGILERDRNFTHCLACAGPNFQRLCTGCERAKEAEIIAEVESLRAELAQREKDFAAVVAQKDAEIAAARVQGAAAMREAARKLANEAWLEVSFASIADGKGVCEHAAAAIAALSPAIMAGKP